MSVLCLVEAQSQMVVIYISSILCSECGPNAIHHSFVVCLTIATDRVPMQLCFDCSVCREHICSFFHFISISCIRSVAGRRMGTLYDMQNSRVETTHHLRENWKLLLHTHINCIWNSFMKRWHMFFFCTYDIDTFTLSTWFWLLAHRKNNPRKNFEHSPTNNRRRKLPQSLLTIQVIVIATWKPLNSVHCSILSNKRRVV